MDFDVNDILESFREQAGIAAQEKAMLYAQNKALRREIEQLKEQEATS